MSRERDVPFQEDQPQAHTTAPLITPLITPEMLPCLECGGGMVEGWVPEYGNQPGTLAVATWYPAPPHTMTKLFRKARILPNPKEAIPIRVFRCVRCGFLKFYARAVG